MKKLLILSILFWTNAHATNYYVSNTGNNSNAGTSAGAAWLTLSKVVSSFGSINSGDSVLLERDGTFYISSSILLTKSGIKFGAYGTGAKPIITTLTTVTGWTLVSTGLYKASVTCPNDLRYVTIDGQPVEWGRTPNKNNGTSSYYYSSSYSNGSPKTITLSGLPTGIDRTGHRFALKGQTWAMGIARVTAQSGNTLTYVPGAENLLGFSPTFRYPSRSGTGICFVGNIEDCDQYGEWAYDSTNHYLYMYFGSVVPSTKIVKTATVDKVFDLVGYNNISIESIDIEGANKAAAFGKNGSGSLSFKKIRFNGSGGKGVLLSNCDNVTVEDDTAVNVYGISFRLPTNATDNCSIKRNYIVDNGPFETMHYLGDDQDGSAIVVGMNNTDILYNTIKRSHYHALWVTGSNVLVQYNYFSRHGMFNNDCGGIYSFALAGSGSITTYTNRVAMNNRIDSGMAWVYGYSSLQSAEVKGIYNDARAHNWLYYNNLIDNCDIGASNNNPAGITLRSNTILSRRGINFRRYKFADLTNFAVKSNVISLLNNTALTYQYVTDSIGSGTVEADMAGDVNIDSNICNSVNTAYNVVTDKGNNNYYFDQWKTVTAQSTNDRIVPYLSVAETGRKLVVNWDNKTNSFPLSYKYSDYNGNNYNNGTISLPAYGFVLLYYTGPLDGEPQPPVITNPGDPVRVPWRTN